MMPLAVYGVGFLISTIQSMSQQGEMNQMRSQMDSQNAAMMKSLKDSANFSVAKAPAPKTKSTFDFDTPPFPEKNFGNLQQMQMKNAQARIDSTNKLQQEMHDMKNDFFGENHYETKEGPNGKPELAMNEHGQPQVAKGPEKPDQKMARLTFEQTKKAQLADTHSEQRQKFMQTEKEKVTEFLTKNREQLGNPAVQAELQRVVVDGKKKALQLQQSQEDERWRVDMPPSQEMANHMSQNLQQLHQMDNKNVEAEEQSPDAMAIMEHDQKVSAILGEQKENAKQGHKEEEFLKDPRKMFASAVASRAPIDVGDKLPGYLTNAVYELGVYQV